MAFTVTETRLDLNNGKAKLYGTYTNTGGSTGGEIIPGVSASSPVSGSSGLRKMLEVRCQPSSSSPAATRYVVAYDTTNDTDKVTITTAADETGNFMIEGTYSGTAAN